MTNELLLIGTLIVLYGAVLLWFYLFGTGGIACTKGICSPYIYAPLVYGTAVQILNLTVDLHGISLILSFG